MNESPGFFIFTDFGIVFPLAFFASFESYWWERARVLYRDHWKLLLCLNLLEGPHTLIGALAAMTYRSIAELANAPSPQVQSSGSLTTATLMATIILVDLGTNSLRFRILWRPYLGEVIILSLCQIHNRLYVALMLAGVFCLFSVCYECVWFAARDNAWFSTGVHSEGSNEIGKTMAVPWRGNCRMLIAGVFLSYASYVVFFCASRHLVSWAGFSIALILCIIWCFDPLRELARTQLGCRAYRKLSKAFLGMHWSNDQAMHPED